MKTNTTQHLWGRRNGRARLLPALLAFLLLTPLSGAAADSEPAPTSNLTGIALEKAQRVTNAKAVSDINEQLEKIAAQGGAGLGTSETLMWMDGYKPAQAPQRMQAVTQALQNAGYVYQKMGEMPMEGGKVTLFGASHAQKREALVGFWLAGDEFLMLGWGQMQKGDKPTASQAPAVKEVLPEPEAPAATPAAPKAATAGASLAGMPRLKAEPGVATGWVADRNGKPIAGAAVTVYSMSNIGRHVFTTVRTNAQGVYRATLTGPYVYVLTAHAPVEFDDSVFKLECNPVGNADAQNGQKGIVRNFMLALTGLRNGPDVDPTRTDHYLGGAVVVVYSPGFSGSGPLPKDSVVTFTFTPKGPLADGSAGKPLIFKRTIKALGNDTMNGMPLDKTRALHDIPLGVYKVTATVEVPGRGALPMSLQAGGDKGSERFQGESVEIHFQANGSFQSQGSVKDISEPRLMVSNPAG